MKNFIDGFCSLFFIIEHLIKAIISNFWYVFGYVSACILMWAIFMVTYYLIVQYSIKKHKN